MDLEQLLPLSVLRNIGSQQYEKRKLAALEVEQLMKKLGAGNDRERIKVVLGRLTDDFALSGLANHRKGGLLCLAAATVGLKHFFDQLQVDYLGQIVRPVAASLSDQDNRVRYYACEALFNIAKAMQDGFITDQTLFIEVYSALFKLYGDPDEHVQNAATHLDEVLKSIVMSSSNFDVECFVQLLQDFLRALDPHKRQFLIGWVTTLSSVPELDMLAYLPDIAGGMFQMLTDEHKEIRHAASKALQEFQKELSSAADEVSMDYKALISVLLEKSKVHQGEWQLCLTTMRWLNTIVEIAQEEIVEQYGMMVSGVLACVSHPREEVQRISQSVNKSLLRIGMEMSWETIDVGGLLDAISKELSSSQPPTRLEALSWLEFLLKQKPSSVLERIDVVMGAVLDALTMPWEKVESSALQLLALLAQQEGQFCFVMEGILDRFRATEGLKLLHRSGSRILQQLCSHLGCRQVFIEISLILDDGDNWGGGLGPVVIQALNVLLVTSGVARQLQIIKLVKLLEAPAFSFLRLQLLEHSRHPGLLQSLHGLLMLLPQTDAYRILHLRLQSGLIGTMNVSDHLKNGDGMVGVTEADCSALVEVFVRRHTSVAGVSGNSYKTLIDDFGAMDSYQGMLSRQDSIDEPPLESLSRTSTI